MANVVHEMPAVATRHALDCGPFTNFSAQAEHLLGELHLFADKRSQPWNPALLIEIVRRQRRDRRQRCRRLTATVFVRHQKSLVADEEKSAIPCLDILNSREESCEPLDDFMRVPNPARPSVRRHRDSVRHHTERDQDDDWHTESELHPPREGLCRSHGSACRSVHEPWKAFASSGGANRDLDAGQTRQAGRAPDTCRALADTANPMHQAALNGRKASPIMKPMGVGGLGPEDTRRWRHMARRSLR
jgi:hypothetical protein